MSLEDDIAWRLQFLGSFSLEDSRWAANELILRGIRDTNQVTREMAKGIENAYKKIDEDASRLGDGLLDAGIFRIGENVLRGNLNKRKGNKR